GLQGPGHRLHQELHLPRPPHEQGGQGRQAGQGAVRVSRPSRTPRRLDRKKARSARARPHYPVARPYAPPPPGTPYHAAGPALLARQRPAPPPGPPSLPPPFLPAVARPLSWGGPLRGLVVIAGVVVLGMASGWYFIQGPGAAALRGLFAPRETVKA